MANLVYASIASLDGYVADADGDFSWATPDREVHAFVNDLVRPAGTHLYGRRMYEVLQGWETAGTDPGEDAVVRDFATIWRGADKIVYSSTLTRASTARTRIVRRFEPAEVARLKATATADLTIGGPGLAAAALRAGLVDELQVVLVPHVVGGGTPYLPQGLRTRLRLLDARRFGNGSAFLRYAVEDLRAPQPGLAT